jgi:FAD-dependent urate hydroxylase
MKAIIIGAGIGGLTTGIALQQVGIDVEIYERVSETKAVGAGLTLWANAIHALDAIGVGDAIRELSVKTEAGGIHSMTGDNIMATDITTLEKHVGIPNIVVHRAELQSVLHDNFNGSIHYTKQLKHYQQSADKVCAYFEDGTQAEGDILIACDGIHSPIRQQMFPDSKPIYAGYTAYRGIVDFDHARVGDMWGESWGYGNRFGFTPLNNNRIYWFATANTPECKSALTSSHKQTLLNMFKGWHNPIEELIIETPDDTILNNGIYEIAPLKSWQDGRVILLGDSAHAMTPNLGQGACQAIEDAVILGQLFCETSDIETVLSHYQQRRIPRSNSILKQSQQMGKMGQLENRLLCNLRNTTFKFIPNSIRIKTLVNMIGYQV